MDSSESKLMPKQKDPLNYEWITYAYVFVLACFGGIASYIQKLKNGYCRFSITELIGKLFISAFVGVVTFFLCEAATIDKLYSAAIIGLSGHMGSKAIILI